MTTSTGRPPRAMSLSKVLSAARDPLYRGSVVLMANTASLAVLGFVFWTVAARSYQAQDVGAFSSLTSGIGLLSAVALLGLPNIITRHIARAESQRGLVVLSLGLITAVGGVLCVLVLVGLGSFLPHSLHLHTRGSSAILLSLLVIVTSLNTAISAALIAIRAVNIVFWTNLMGAASKIAALLFLTSLKSTGLLVAYGIGIGLPTVISGIPLIVKARPGQGFRSSYRVFNGYLSASVKNYVASILGILPSTVVPLEVLTERGAAQTAVFAVAFLITGFLNVIPSTVSQVMFAESSRRGATMTKQLRKATRAIGLLLIPVLLVVLAGAGLIMRVFGPAYSAEGAGPLRILAIAALIGSGNYLIDAALIGRDRSTAYLAVNGLNAALVLLFVAAGLRFGLTGGAVGWALAQTASLVIGLVVIATGRSGRHRRVGNQTAARPVADFASAAADITMPDLYASRPNLYATMPDLYATMPDLYGFAVTGPGPGLGGLVDPDPADQHVRGEDGRGARRSRPGAADR